MDKMNTDQPIEFYEGFDDTEATSGLSARVSKKRLSKKGEMEAKLFIRAQEISRDFRFTYKAARFEEAWLLDSLVQLAEQQWISDVLRKAKAGKEASVYLCRPGAAVSSTANESNFVAAKVYRPRMLRNLKNDHRYREGRADLDGEGNRIVKAADLHAMAKRTSYGEELRHQSWIAHEFDAMRTLFDAGADIPYPYALAGNVILMDFIGDAAGSAPSLNEVALERSEARPLFDRVIRNVDILLGQGIIHGDLSAYNILYWEGGVTLIDFPQVVSPTENRDALRLFERDVKRVCDYFAGQGVRSDARRLACDLWTGHGYKLREEVHPRLLDPEDKRDRRLWEKQKENPP